MVATAVALLEKSSDEGGPMLTLKWGAAAKCGLTTRAGRPVVRLKHGRFDFNDTWIW